jgi:sulfite reductase alpha subunit-like flavoprotein
MPLLAPALRAGPRWARTTSRTLREGDCLNLFFDSADVFHLQEDATKPMIFVCADTGLALMRAFLRERLAIRHAGVSVL